MNYFSNDLISIFQYMLPGFLAAWIFYGLTSHPIPSAFERVIQALIFTLVVQAVVVAEETVLLQIGNYWVLGQWDEQSVLFCSIVSAVLLGIAFSYFSNNDGLHRLARKIGITRETSYPSEWFGTFLNNTTYVVLHLEDERRLYGWPIEWPSAPTQGHFVFELASWVHEEKEVPITGGETGVEYIMIDVQDVKWVEFMEKNWRQSDG